MLEHVHLLQEHTGSIVNCVNRLRALGKYIHTSHFIKDISYTSTVAVSTSKMNVPCNSTHQSLTNLNNMHNKINVCSTDMKLNI